MSRKLRVRSATGFYHVVLRGVNHQILFIEEEDYLFFLKKLRYCLEEEKFEIHAFCLMDNHVHLLIHADSGLDRIIKRIAGSYAMYFNNKYERCGHLYQDRFSSEPVEDERYLLAVVRYIHNNPQKAGICLRNFYRWSSIHAYNGLPDSVTTTKLVLQVAGGLDNFFTLSSSDEEVECLDIDPKKHSSDQNYLDAIRKEFQLSNGIEVQNLNEKQKKTVVRFLYENGASLKTMERLTGIGKRQIATLIAK